jgi:hypothetical protein
VSYHPKINAVTHGGKHHADDLLAAFFLRSKFGPALTVTRSNDKRVHEAADVLFDVGGVYDPQTMRFDHHGRVHNLPSCEHRPKGYATAGLVWLAYGRELCRRWMMHRRDSRWSNYVKQFPTAIEDNIEEVWRRLDVEVIAGIDNWDTGSYQDRTPRGLIPVQWVVPILDFDVGSNMLGLFLINQMNRILEKIADLAFMRRDMMHNGSCEFYHTPCGVLVVGGSRYRVEIGVARKVVWESMREQCVGIVSMFKQGDRWLFLAADPIPREISIPACFEVHPGRRMVFHNSRSFLLTYARGLFDKIHELQGRESDRPEDDAGGVEHDAGVPDAESRGGPPVGEEDGEGSGG